MNIIENHADKFYPIMINESGYGAHVDKSISKCRLKLHDYHKDSHKIIFLNRLMVLAKMELEKHHERCKKTDCAQDKFTADLLFFLNEEIIECRRYVTEIDFSQEDNVQVNQFEVTMLEHVKAIHSGNEIIYEDFMQEFAELKSYLHLTKKAWLQMFAGKVLEMVAGGVIEEASANKIIDFANQQWETLFSQTA